MNISVLKENFSKHIIRESTPIPGCSFEEGIRFFMPVPDHCSPGSIFVGTPQQWQVLKQRKQFIDSCTYIICTENEDEISRLRFPKTCNFYCLKANAYMLIQRLNNIVEACASSAASNLHETYLQFWNDIMEDKFPEYRDIVKASEKLPYPLHAYTACIVVRHETYIPSEFNSSQIEEALSDFFTKTNLFYNNNEWIIIYSQDEVAIDTLSFSYDAFSSLLEKYHLNAGISYASHWANLFKTLYMTAAASIDLGTKLTIAPKHRRIYTYLQFNPYYIVHLSYRKFSELFSTSVIYLTHPDVFFLWSKDPDLFEVLYVYLRNGRSIADTSQELFMHRNTVCNKIKKIEAALSHDINDPEYQLLLLLSCMLIKFHSEYI